MQTKGESHPQYKAKKPPCQGYALNFFPHSMHTATDGPPLPWVSPSYMRLSGSS